MTKVFFSRSSLSLLIAALANVQLLNADTRLTEEVIVSANLLTKSSLEMASPAVILDKQALNFASSNSIGDTLASLPGLSATAYGQGASRPIIRGLDGPRVRLLNDGLGMLDASDVSPDHAVTTEPWLAESIEVLKGPATLLYGGGAIGGVVNVLDKRIPTKAIGQSTKNQSTKKSYEGALETRRDTVNSSETTLATATASNDKLAVHVEGLLRDGKDYSIDGDSAANPPVDESFENRMPNSFNDGSNYSVGGSLLQDNGFIGLAYSRQLSQYGLPNEPDEAPYIDLDQQRVDLRGEWELQNSVIEKLRVRAADNDYLHREIAEGEIGTTFENDAQEARVELVHQELAGWKGLIGGQAMLRDFSAIGEEAYVPQTDTHNFAVFALEEYQLNNWRFELGARHEWQDINAGDNALDDVDHRGNSFSSGAVWEFIDGFSAHATLSRSQRLPTAEELYAEGPHLATSTFEIGNIDLDEETANNIEFSLRKNSGALTGELTVYQNRIGDFIYARDTGNVVDEDGLPAVDGFREVIYSQADSTFRGVEAELRYAFSENFSAGIFGDRVKGQLDDSIDDNDNLPRIPANRVGVKLNHSLAIQGNTLSSDVMYYRVNKQGNSASFETDTDGYDELGLGINYRMPMANNTAVEVFVNGNNLLDEEQRAHTSFIKDIVPLPGRNLSLGARLFF